jgi:hypothetical protein
VDIDKLKRHKSPGIDQIQTEMFKAGRRTILSEIHEIINYSWNKEKLPERSGRTRSLYLSIRRMIKQIVVIIETYHFCQLHTKFYPTSWCPG